MPTPTAAFSVTIRVRFDNQPGALGKLAAAIGEVGGNIVRLEGFEAREEYLDQDLIVNCSSEQHMADVEQAIHDLSGVQILSVGDRTFDMHDGGKVEVLARMEITDSDDLSMAYTPGVARVCTAIADDPVR